MEHDTAILSAKVDLMAAQVTQLNVNLMGRGGLFDRIDKLEKTVAEQETFKTRLIAWGSVASVAVAVAWNFVIELFKHKNP